MRTPVTDSVKLPRIKPMVLAEKLGLPPNLTKEILQTLTQARLLTETRGAEYSFVPARPLARISVRDVLQAMRCGSGSDLVTAADSQRPIVSGVLQEIRSAADARAESVSFEQLVRQSAKAV